MNEAPLSPSESLQLIDSMINKAKNRFSENGYLYLLWGWVVLICSLGHFILEQVVRVENFYLIWLLTWGALIYQFIYLRNKKRNRKVTTYTDHIIKYVWICFIIMMLLMVMVVLRFATNPHNTDAVFLVLYGLPTFLSGNILKFPALIRGGIICWLLAIISLFIQPEYHMLLISAAVVAAWIVPGYLLKRQFNRAID